MSVDEKLRREYGHQLEKTWKLRHLKEKAVPDDFYAIDLDMLLTDYDGNILAILEIKADKDKITANEIVTFNRIKSGSTCPVYIIEPTSKSCKKMRVYEYIQGDPVFGDVNLETIGDDWDWGGWSKFEADLRQISKN